MSGRLTEVRSPATLVTDPAHEARSIALREHRDVGGGRIGTDPPAGFQPVHPRHHDVEDDQIGALGVHLPKTLLAVGGGPHLIALDPQVHLDDVEQPGIVVHDEDAALDHSGGSR